MVEMALLETAKWPQRSLLRAKMVEMALLQTAKTPLFHEWEPLGSKWLHPKEVFEKTIEGGIQNH